MKPDIEEGPPSLTDPSTGLNDEEVAKALETYGPNEIPVKETPLYVIFLRQFVGFLPLLIELAALISLAIGDYVDFGIIAGILAVNAVLGFREEYHAKLSLREVSQSIQSEITVRRNGETQLILSSKIVPGDIVFLVGGTVVPADVKWIMGDTLQIDTAPLTGEPLPRKYPSKDYGDIILSGTTVVAGECYAQVLRTGTKTEIGKAQADILKDKSIQVVSVFQQKIMHVIQILISTSLALVVAVLIVEGVAYNGFDDDVKQTVLNALSIMIASIPVALPLVIQVNLALGASFLAKKHNAIVTTIPALQDIASMSMLCSDKTGKTFSSFEFSGLQARSTLSLTPYPTGTLTSGKMSIIPDKIYAADGFQDSDVILYAYLCSNADKKDDPIDRAIVKAFQESEHKDKATEFKQTEIIGFNPTVKRVVAFVKRGDETWTIAKGLPAKIVDTAAGSIDDHELQWKVKGYQDKSFLRKLSTMDTGLSKAGYKTIGIAVCNGNAREQANPEWKFVGLLPMLDPPRSDTAATIESLHHANISVKMITGDHVNVGKETARLIGLGVDIRAGEEVRNSSGEEKKNLVWEADGFAAVLPSDKRDVVLTLRNEFGVVTGMTGDGVNDAPALSAAQVGIAVQGATDAAKNAADLILTEPGLSPIYGAVLESRRIFARIKAYVIYRVAASIILVLTLSILLFASGCAVDALLIIILALLNDISMIPVAYDRASATTKPQIPNAKKLVLTSLFYGGFHSAAGLIFLFGLQHDQGIKYPISLERECSEETRGLIWFHLVLVTELMIFSVRAPGFMLKSMPSLALLSSVIGTCIGAAFIAVYASDLSVRNMGWVLLYNVGALVVVDVCKIFFRKTIHDEPGDVIENDDLLVPTKKSDAAQSMEKKLRYVSHRASLLNPEDREHVIVVRDTKYDNGLVSAFFSELRPMDITDGFVNRRHERQISLASLSSSTGFAGVHRLGRQKTTSTPW